MRKGHILLNEMFASLQGEGLYVGTPMLFIRTAGCNLRCSWCDQPDSVADGFRGTRLKGVPTSIADIMHWVGNADNTDYHHVCLTGGEPTLQDLTELVGRLHMADKVVHIETNGTHAPEWLRKVDHVCLSPKRGAEPHIDLWDMAHEVKLIIDADSQFKEVQEILNIVPERTPVYLQPANHLDSVDKDMLVKTMDFVSEDPHQLRLSIQLHKVLGVH